MEENRPDPEQLLRQVKKEAKQRGKLKIFFGACAGVGKTYAMLLAAQEKYKEGVNVVAGLIETHGRQETIKLLEGIPRLPLREIEYHGIVLKELDIDAAIQQSPSILLVDELAHTNAIGSRHPKRWQDVQELLESGIDIYTTLNVQHLESLNDMITNVTGVRVKETVPDSIFDNADEIVLVDIPSEAILERLSEGKVYLGEFAKQRAAQHFFKMENLIALREIALRRTAERVDALRDIYKKYQNTKQNISDNILVCIGPNLPTKLIRTAKQLATKLKSPWTALHVENPQHYRLSKEEQQQIQKALHLAEQLGGKAQILQEANTSKAILEYARANNFTKIIVGRTPKSKWKFCIFKSLINQIIERSGNIDVYIITEDTAPPPLARVKLHDIPWLAYLYALGVTAICTLLGLPTTIWSNPSTALMLYLAGIVIVAASSGASAAILTTLLSVTTFNFFFMHPFYSFSTYEPADLITLLIMLLTGLVIGIQTSRLREQRFLARQREKFTNELYALSTKLIATPGRAKIAQVVSHHISEIFESAATVWLPNTYGFLELVSHPDAKIDAKIEVKEQSVAEWAFKHNQEAGLGTDTMPSARGYYIPLASGKEVYGVLGVIPKETKHAFTVEDNMLLGSLALQTALAFERVKVAEETRKKEKHRK